MSGGATTITTPSGYMGWRRQPCLVPGTSRFARTMTPEEIEQRRHGRKSDMPKCEIVYWSKKRNDSAPLPPEKRVASSPFSSYAAGFGLKTAAK